MRHLPPVATRLITISLWSHIMASDVGILEWNAGNGLVDGVHVGARITAWMRLPRVSKGLGMMITGLAPASLRSDCQRDDQPGI